MPLTYILSEYLSRNSIYVLWDGECCLYVGKTNNGQAGVASRITNHLTNSRKPKPTGNLPAKINNRDRPEGYLNWRLEIYSVPECERYTNQRLKSVNEAEKAMIKLFNPVCNVKHKR